MATEARGGGSISRDNLALGLGVGAAIAWVIGFFISGEDGDQNGWIWFVMAALGLGGLVVGLLAGNGKPKGKALIGAALGGVLLLVFLLFAFGILG